MGLFVPYLCLRQTIPLPQNRNKLRHRRRMRLGIEHPIGNRIRPIHRPRHQKGVEHRPRFQRQQHRPRLLAEIEDVDVIEPLGVRDLDLGMLPLKRGAQVIDGGGVPALADEQPLPIELLEADAGPAGVPTGP